MHRRRQVQQWLLWVLFVLVIVGVQTWQLRAAHERTRLSQESRLRQQAQLLGARLELQLVAIDAGLRSVAADLPGWSARGDSTEVHARLKALDAAIVGVRTLAVISESGLISAASRDGLAGIDVSGLPYFSKARNDNNAKRVYVSAPYRTRLGVWSLNVVRVLQRPDGRFAGAVVATLDPQWLAVTVGSVNYAADMWSGLTHTEGGLLFLAPASRTGLEGANLARPESMFSRHLASGETETLLEGAIAITGQWRRVIVQRTLQPAGLELEGNLVIGTSRSLDGMYADWQEHVIAALWLTTLLAGITAAGLVLIQRGERRRALLTTDLDRLAKVAQRTSNAVVITDSSRRIVWVNDGFTRICGYTLDEVRGRVPGHILQSEMTDPETVATIRQGLASGNGFRAELCNRTKDGRDYWVDIDVQPLSDAAGQVNGFMAVETDITEARSTRMHLERLAREQAVMLDSELVGIVKLRDRKAVWSNRGLARMFGYSPEALQGAPARLLYSDDESFAALGAAAYPVLRKGETYRTQMQMQHSSGALLWVDLSGMLVSNEPEESMWLMVDITAMKQRHAVMEEAAFHDGLTGLPNRALLADRLGQALELAKRQKQPLAVAYMDLDGFKKINDTHGHDAGDAVLRAVAGRLPATLRSSDTVARLGGDEFAIVLSPAGTRSEAADVLQRVQFAVAEPVDLESGGQVRVGASIGLAWYPQDGDDGSVLLSLADERMFEVKRARHAAGSPRQLGEVVERA